MPNHITNCVTIEGEEEQLRAFEERVIKQNSDGVEYFDFEAIIPPPENMFRGDLSHAKRQQCNDEGRANWYDWQSEHWGTKWNAYSFERVKREPGKLHIQFDTAWLSPEPIFRAIVKEGFDVYGVWKDEGYDEIHDILGDCGDWYPQTTFHLL